MILSNNYKNVIDSFLNDNDYSKYLLISGNPGTGKTTLANHIFKDNINLIIDSSHIKYYKNNSKYDS